jgi:AAA domain
MKDIVTAVVDENFDVHQRLARMRGWQNEYFSEDEQLQVRLRQLDTNKPLDVQRRNQIVQLREILILKQVREPLEIVNGADQPGERHWSVRQNLVRQFTSLSKLDRLSWLGNFLFILTPDLLRLHKKILEYCALDQQCHFLLSAPSGMGKTTYFNWLVALNLPSVEEQRRLAPVVVKINAPLRNDRLKTLLQTMLLACGATYLKDDSEDVLALKLGLYRQQSNVRLIIVDDVEHIPYAKMRNYLLHISSVVHSIPIICASTNPAAWAGGYKQIVGSWTDYGILSTYTGERLRDLLVFFETLLPFTKEPGLFLAERNVGTEVIDGPAKLIEKWTGGILRDVVMLLMRASRRAIEDDLPCLSPQLLEEAWKEIKTERVENFF